jgi:hypothetical protein
MEQSLPLSEPVVFVGASLDVERCSDGDERVNGFRTVPELEMIRVAEEELAPFSMPEEVLSFEPKAAAMMTRFKNGDCERMIHHGAEFDDTERQQLRMLQVEAQRQNLALFPSIARAATRALMDTRGDHKLALQKMKSVQEWRMNFFKDGPLKSDEIAGLLKHGIIYFCGRDRMMRPALVLRLGRLPPDLLVTEGGTQTVARVVVFCMEYFQKYMAAPGKVENLSLILDVKGVSVNIAKPAALKAIRAALCQQSAGVVFRFYVLNMSMMMRVVSSMVQGLMTERQKQKIIFVSRVEELRTEFAPNQLEADLGGTRSNITEFWPFPLAPANAWCADVVAKQGVPLPPSCEAAAVATRALPSLLLQLHGLHGDGDANRRADQKLEDLKTPAAQSLTEQGRMNEADSRSLCSGSTTEGRSSSVAPSSPSSRAARCTKGDLNDHVNLEDCAVEAASMFSCRHCSISRPKLASPWWTLTP